MFVRTSKALAARGVHVRTTPDGEPAYTEAQVDREDGDEVWWRASVPVVNVELGYRFLIETGTPGRRLWLNGTGLSSVDVTDAADFRLPTYDPPPAWAEGAVLYEIFPDRFARSAAHPVGDLPDWAVPAKWEDPVAYGTPAGTQQVYGGTLWGVAEKLASVIRVAAARPVAGRPREVRTSLRSRGLPSCRQPVTAPSG